MKFWPENLTDSILAKGRGRARPPTCKHLHLVCHLLPHSKGISKETPRLSRQTTQWEGQTVSLRGVGRLCRRHSGHLGQLAGWFGRLACWHIIATTGGRLPVRSQVASPMFLAKTQRRNRRRGEARWKVARQHGEVERARACVNISHLPSRLKSLRPGADSTPCWRSWCIY